MVLLLLCPQNADTECSFTMTTSKCACACSMVKSKWSVTGRDTGPSLLASFIVESSSLTSDKLVGKPACIRRARRLRKPVHIALELVVKAEDGAQRRIETERGAVRMVSEISRGVWRPRTWRAPHPRTPGSTPPPRAPSDPRASPPPARPIAPRRLVAAVARPTADVRGPPRPRHIWRRAKETASIIALLPHDRTELRDSGLFHTIHDDHGDHAHAQPPAPGGAAAAPVQAHRARHRRRQQAAAAPGARRRHQLRGARGAREAEHGHRQAPSSRAGAVGTRGHGLRRGGRHAGDAVQAEPRHRRGGREEQQEAGGDQEEEEAGEDEICSDDDDDNDGDAEEDSGGEEPAAAADGPGKAGGDAGSGRREGRRTSGRRARVRGGAAAGARRVDRHGQPRLEADEDPAGALRPAERPPLQDHAAHEGHFGGAREPAQRAAERADGRRGCRGHEHAGAAATAAPRCRPGGQEQAHQAQPTARPVCDQQVLPGHDRRREVRGPVPGRRQRAHHGHRPLRAQARLPHLHLRALLDPPLRRPRHDALQFHPLPIRHGIGEAGGQQGEGGAVVRAREDADGRGDDEESGAVAGEVPRRGADDEAGLLAPLAEPCHAGGAHQGGHRRRCHRCRHPQAQPAPPPRHRRPPGFAQAQGERGDQAEVRAGRQGEAHTERDRRQPEDLEGDGAQVRAQGAHEAQAPHPGGLPTKIHVKLSVSRPRTYIPVL